MAVWSIIAAPLLMSTDVAKMPAASKADLLNAEVLAVNSDALGRQGWRIRNEGSLQVWLRSLMDGSVVVALHSSGNTTTQVVTASLVEVGLGDTTAVTVRDLFVKEDLSPVAANGTVSATVEPHGVAMLRLSPH